MQALADGKTIQIRAYDGWVDHDQENIYFRDKPENYRIKSTPTLRPWKPEEVPVGALIQYKPERKDALRGLRGFDVAIISGIHGFRILTPCRFCNFTADFVLDNCNYSLDHGITWKPCGIVE